MIYVLILLAGLSTHTYAFYKGYQWASKDHVIKQQTAKIRHIEISNRYFKSASQQSKNEANIANERLAVTASKLNQIEEEIRQGKYTKACSDEFFDKLRRAQ